MKKIGLLMLTLAFLTTACAKKNLNQTTKPKEQPAVTTTQAPKKETAVTTVTPKKPEPTPMEVYELKYSKLPLSHTVVKGECLWWIAEYKNIYNDPFMWPLIFKANRDKIKNPDLIYPDQTFSIPRNFTLQEVKASRQQAGAARPYTPPEQANIPANIRQELGWKF